MDKEPEQIDFTKYFTPTDFDSPEVKEQMKIIVAQINEVLDGAKIDRTKMFTVFNIESFCKNMGRNGGNFGMKVSDYIRYGVVYGAMASYYNSNQPQGDK